MKKVSYSEKPAAFEAIGLGRARYRWAIETVTVADHSALQSSEESNLQPSEETHTEWQCYEFEVPDTATTPQALLTEAKRQRLAELEAYDSSDSVNIFHFTISEGVALPHWFSVSERTRLTDTTRKLKESGETERPLWFNDNRIVLPLDDIISILNRLEVYASNCYDITAQHRLAIQALTTVEDIFAYDITAGYPHPLTF